MALVSESHSEKHQKKSSIEAAIPEQLVNLKGQTALRERQTDTHTHENDIPFASSVDG